MANGPFTPQPVEDVISAFADGVNMGIAPLLLPKNQLAAATNGTVRGTLVTQRPAYRKIDILFEYPSDAQNTLSGKYQGGGYYRPDNGFESLMAQISGRLFQFTPGTNTASIIERTIPGDPNPVAPNQVWMWQAEQWMIVMDGVSKPIFFTQNPAGADPNTRRSTWNTNVAQPPTVVNMVAGFIVPAVGNSTGVAVTVVDASNMNPGDVLTFKNFGNFIVQSVAGFVATLVNQNAPVGKTVPNGTSITWFHVSTELPPGRMGAYGLGQNWYSLSDARQFLASDQVGASSGTQPYNYRDSVLNITQNLYLAGGGNFLVPSTAGIITAMVFAATLDVSLGQGPLQVVTTNSVFNCQVPADRLTWQSVTNPILAEAVIGNGGTGQWSTVPANSDTIMRSVDGIFSFIMSRRDFNTWGNVPISREVAPILAQDSPDLLQFSSAVVFNNRLLMTAKPVLSDQGIYWQRLVALNFDPVSSLRGKAASVYDGSWVGLNVLQVITGQFSNVQRCFAFCLNTITNTIELYEILKDEESYFDNDTTRITSVYETPVMLKRVPGKDELDLCKIEDGEVWIDSIRGTTDVQVWYRPDSYPCWIPWHKFGVCNPIALDDPFSKPAYRTRLGLGQPRASDCESANDRPTRSGYWFQFRFVFTGPHRFLGFKVKGVTEPQPMYAKVAGCCENEVGLQFGQFDTSHE